MNEHEVDLLAGSIHLARPDWPLKSLRTFIASKLGARPYRDAFVALAWVACEPGTHTPARVLEAGPWWRAAAVDGVQANHPERLEREDRCQECGKSRARCEATEAGWRSYGSDDYGHDFRPDYMPDRGAPRPAELTTTVPVRGAEQHTTQEDK